MLRPLQKPSTLVSGSVRRLAIPIHVPFTISRESLPVAHISLIELRTAAGGIGLGESAPFPSLTHDTIEQASSLALQLLEELRSRTATEALERLGQLKEEIVRQSITAYVGLESALWDLYAREQGLSLAQLWGSSGTQRLSTDITLPIMAPEAVAGFWQLYQAHEFQIIKVKVSGQLEQDMEMIQALLKVLPPGLQLTLDGNQGYRVDQALRLVNLLMAQDCRPLFFEQPLPEDDYAGLARLVAQLPIPVCVDETVRTLADAGRVIDQQLAHMINIKIMKSGIAETLAIIELAQRARMPLMIGGMLESEVATGISLHLACGSGAIAYADLDTPFFFTRRVTKDSPWHRPRATLELPKGVGHGMEALH